MTCTGHDHHTANGMETTRIIPTEDANVDFPTRGEARLTFVDRTDGARVEVLLTSEQVWALARDLERKLVG